MQFSKDNTWLAPIASQVRLRSGGTYSGKAPEKTIINAIDDADHYHYVTAFGPLRPSSMSYLTASFERSFSDRPKT